MGRRPDPGSVQVAKGNPRKRGSKALARMVEAERIAGLMADAPADPDDQFAPPMMLTDPAAAPALKVWRDYAPELRRTHRLGKLHRLHFAMFCVYMGEWIAALEDVRKNGKFQKVPTISGGVWEKRRPILDWMQVAYSTARDLGSDFGLTPSEEYALFKDQRVAAQTNPGLFPADERPAQLLPDLEDQADTTIPPPPQRTLIGGLAGLDSPPPGGKPN